MKKILKLLITVISIFTITLTASASNDGGRPPRPEKISREDFYKGLKLNSDVKAQVKVILNDFKLTLDKNFKDSKMPPDREKIDKFIKVRDSRIKPLLTKKQYETYKKTVEGLFVPEDNGRGPNRDN